MNEDRQHRQEQRQTNEYAQRLLHKRIVCTERLTFASSLAGN
jgi:hypothetical protein